MRAFLAQIIVIILLLICGYVLYNTYSGPIVTTKEWGKITQENGNLRRKNTVLAEKNGKLTDENRQLFTENEKLTLANKYLKIDFRTARVEVLEQKMAPENTGSAENAGISGNAGSAENTENTENVGGSGNTEISVNSGSAGSSGNAKNSGKVLETKIRFTEFDPENGSIVAKPAEFTIRGDMIYVDALVVKFDDRFVENADALRNRSLISFQRVFGENQTPAEGYRIDAEGMIPSVYRSGSENEEASAFEKKIWENFWEISNSPERQKELGIRAIHGEAPSQRLVPGRIYYLNLRASDGLSFRVE